MKKSPLAITVPSIDLSINSVTKPCLYDTIVSIENKVIYFGSNWKLPFSAISNRTISQLEDLLDEYDNNQGRLTGREDISIVFQSDDASKVFECFFDNVSAVKKEIIKFLNEFIKRYDKWELKHNRKVASLDNEYTTSTNFGKSNARADSSNLSSRSSRFFADNSRNSRQIQNMKNSSASMVKTGKKATKYKSKLDKLKGKILSKMKQEEYYSSDDDISLGLKMQPKLSSKIESVSKTHTDVQVDVEENVTSKRNSLGESIKQRSKLKKKAIKRNAIEDDESDIDFGENDKAPQLSNAKFFNDDDDDNDDDLGEMDGSRLNTELTQGRNNTGSVTPLRRHNRSSLTDLKTVDDVVTDDDVSDTSQITPKIKAPTSGIRSFFTSKIDDKKLKLPSGGTMKNIAKSLMAEKRQSIKNQQLRPPKTNGLENSLVTSPVRTILSPSTDKICKKRKTFDSLTPPRLAEGSPKLKSVKFCSRLFVPSKTSPIKNPYQKTTPPRTLENTHLGLKNLGNTCYINSSLQVLFSLPHFLDRLGSIYKRIKSTEAQADDTETMPLCSAILTVASALRLIPPLVQNDITREGTANPSILKKEIDNLTDKFAGYEQRDAHEFLSDLIDMLHEELTVSSRSKKCIEEDCKLPTDEYFCLTVNVTLTCVSCNYSRSKQEMYRHLSIDIGSNTSNQEEPWTIMKGLENFFKPEVRDIKCEKCKEGTSVTQTISVTSRPKALLLHLKRFRMEAKDGQVLLRKSSGCVKSCESVSLDSFMESTEDTNKTSFGLKGVVCHIGNSSLSGHYTADALRKNAKGTNLDWVHFDDGVTSLTRLSDVLDSEGSQSNNYLMLYGLE